MCNIMVWPSFDLLPCHNNGVMFDFGFDKIFSAAIFEMYFYLRYIMGYCNLLLYVLFPN